MEDKQVLADLFAWGHFGNPVGLQLSHLWRACESDAYYRVSYRYVAALSVVVLILGAGCNGCITEAENFFVTHACDSSTLFIFTRVSSVKNLWIKMGREKFSLPNVYIDKNSKFYFPEYDKCIYPCLIYLKEGRPERFANLDERMIRVDDK